MHSRLLALLFAVAAAFAAQAETYTWTGAQDAFWTNAANWQVNGEPAANPPGEYFVYNADASGSLVSTNGVPGDVAVFGEFATENRLINLDGESTIQSVVVTTDASGVSQAFTFGDDISGSGTPEEQAQLLKIHQSGNFTIEEGVTADQTIQGLCVRVNPAVSGNKLIGLVNKSPTAQLIYKRNGRFNKIGSATLPGAELTAPYYHVSGKGTIYQDGPTDYDSVYGMVVSNANKIVMGETAGSGSYRVWWVQFLDDKDSTVREINIPSGRYLHGVTGGWTGKQIETYVDTKVTGTGSITAEKHYNTTLPCGANLAVSSGKTLTIESGVSLRPVNGYTSNIGLWFAGGTLVLETVKNYFIGDVRIHDSNMTLKAKKLGLKSDAAGTTSLGTADKILFYNTGCTLCYDGEEEETTDRTLALTNSATITATVENQGGGLLRLRTPLMQCNDAATGMTLGLKATTNPIEFDGSFESGKTWAVTVSGGAGVGFKQSPTVDGEDVPVTIANGGKLTVSDLWTLPESLSFASGTANIAILEGYDAELENIPDVPDGTVLNYVVPETSSLSFWGETSRRLANVTLNGRAAQLKDGRLVEATVETPTWIKPNMTGYWSDVENWLEKGVPLNGERVYIMPMGENHLDNSITINIDEPVTVKHLRIQDSVSGKIKLTGTGSLTVGSGNATASGYANYGGIAVMTNAVCHGQGSSHGHGIPDLDVPVTVQSGETYFCWPSDRGWTIDPNTEPSIHAITKDFNKTDGAYMNFAGCDGWLSFRQGGGDYRAPTRVMGYVEMLGTNQFKRLGTNGIALETYYLNAFYECWASPPLLLYSLLADESEATVPNAIAYSFNANFNKRSTTGPYYGGICFQTADGTTSLSATNRLTLTGAITGSSSNLGNPNSENCGFFNSNGKNCIEKNARFLSPESSRIVLAGNSPTATNKINGMTVNGFVEIAHANALGTGNTMKLVCGNDGYWTTAQPAGLNGVLVRPGITYAGEIASRPAAEADAFGISHYTVVGAATAGEGEATFTGSVYENVNSGYVTAPLRFHAPKGGKARFTGIVTGKATGENAATVLAEGDIILANAQNSFAKPIQVRAGRLVLAADGAAGSQPVSLGGIVRVLPGFETVVALDDGSGIGSHPAGWGWWSLNETPAGGSTIWYSGTWLHFNDNKHPESIDGVPIANNQKILINSPDKKAANGFWTVAADSYKRPWEYKQYPDYKGLYGTKFKVTGGNKYGGKTFFFAIDVASTKLSGVMDATAGNKITARSLAFHEEPTDADVAVMTEGAVTIANDIEVTRNYSAGKSTIGGVSAAVSGFSGDVTLAKSVTLSAAAGGQVNFTGAFSGDGDIIAEGAGTVDLTGATVSTASTNVIALAAGTLKLTSAQTSAKGLKWIRRVNGASDSTGVLSVDGNLDLTHATFEGFTFDDETDTEHALKIAEATGSIYLPEKMRINKRWTLFVDNGSVCAKAAIPGLMIRIK